MNTLRELGEFIGLPASAAVAGHAGPDTISLEMAGRLVTTLGDPERKSLRRLIDAVAVLPPVTLEIALAGPREGVEPFQTAVRLNGCSGAVWRTSIRYGHGGQLYGPGDNLRGAGGTYPTTPLGTGEWSIVVTRSGLSNTGPVDLRRSIDRIRVRGHEEPDPPPDPPPKKPAVPTCEVSFVRYQGDATVVVNVHGSGFVAGETVYIFQDGVAPAATTATADNLTLYSVELSLFRAMPQAVEHTFKAVSADGTRAAVAKYAA
jgi:hypothetical protein